jgi:hypothetical protein
MSRARVYTAADGRTIALHVPRDFSDFERYEPGDGARAYLGDPGEVRVDAFEGNGQFVQSITLAPGDCVLCTEGHQIHLLSADARIVEVKQGPYPGSPAADRRVIQIRQ